MSQAVRNNSTSALLFHAGSRTAVTRQRLSVVTERKKPMKTISTIALIIVFALPGCCLAQCLEGSCAFSRVRVSVERPAPIRTFAANRPVHVEYVPSYARVQHVAAPSYGCQGGGSAGFYSTLHLRSRLMHRHHATSHGSQGGFGCQGH